MSIAFTELRQKADAEWQALTAGDKPWIRVGLGTSGEAAGAEAVYDALKESLGSKANVSFVGSMGLCYAEPLIDGQLPGVGRVFYNNVDASEAPALVAACGRRPAAARCCRTNQANQKAAPESADFAR